MYSWWNAITCGLDRPRSAQDKGRGHGYLNRAIDLHKALYVVIAVGTVAQDVVKASRTSIKVLTTRSPLRSSSAQRERIRAIFGQARMDAYPPGPRPELTIVAAKASHAPSLHLPCVRSSSFSRCATDGCWRRRRHVGRRS